MEKREYKDINISIYGYLFISMLLLAISNIFGVWFENFAGVIYGIFGVLGVSRIIIQNNYRVKDKSMFLYLYLISIVLTIFINSMVFNIIQSQYVRIFSYLFVFLIMPFLCGKYFAFNSGKFNIKIISIMLLLYGVILILDIIRGNGVYGYRIFGTIGNSLLQATAIMCLGSIVLAITIKSIRGVFWYTFFSIILILIGSRGVAVSYIISGALGIYAYRRSDFFKIIKLLFSLSLCMFILFIFFKKNFFESDFFWRWQLMFQDIKINGIKFSTIDPTRYNLLIYGINIFKENYIFGNIFYDGLSGLYVHNFWIDILVRTGIIGASIFFIFLLSNYKRYVFKSYDDFTQIAFKIIFISMIINGTIATTLFYNPVFWVSFGYIISYKKI